MPLEIREIVIKANIEREPGSKKQGQTLDPLFINQLKEEIVEECLEKLEYQIGKRLER